MGNVSSKASGAVSSSLPPTTPSSATSTRPGSPEVKNGGGRPSLSLHTRPPYKNNTGSSITDSGHGSSSPTTSQSGHSLLLSDSNNHHQPQRQHPPVPPKDPHCSKGPSSMDVVVLSSSPGCDGRSSSIERATSASTNKPLPDSPDSTSSSSKRAHSLTSLLTTSQRALSPTTSNNKELPEIRHISDNDDDINDDKEECHQQPPKRTLSNSSTKRKKHNATTISNGGTSSSPQAIIIPHPAAMVTSPPAVQRAFSDDGDENRRSSTNNITDDQSPQRRSLVRAGLSSSLPSSSFLSSLRGSKNGAQDAHNHRRQDATAMERLSIDTNELGLRRFATGETLLSEHGRSRKGSSTTATDSTSKRPSSWIGHRASSSSSSNNNQDGSDNGNGSNSDQHNRSKNNSSGASRSTSIVSSLSARSLSGTALSSSSSAFKFSKPNLSFMPLYSQNSDSKRQNAASTTALQGGAIRSSNGHHPPQVHQQQQQRQQASPFPEELLSMRLPQSLLDKYVMDTESFRQGKGFWGIGKYSWTITVQARSNGKKYVIKRVAKSLLPPEAYYRYPTTAHRLCTCPACKSRREQLLQSGLLDRKDVEEVLALHNTGTGNASNTRGYRRDPSQPRLSSQLSSSSASSSNLNLMGVGGMATTMTTSTNKKKRTSASTHRSSGSMSPTRLFGRNKSRDSTPQATPVSSRPSTPMMTPLSRPGTPSLSPSSINSSGGGNSAHKSSHTSHNTLSPNHNHNNTVVNTTTPPTFQAFNSSANHNSSEDVSPIKHSRSKSYIVGGGSLRVSSTSNHSRPPPPPPPALSVFGRTASQDKVAQTNRHASGGTLLSPISPIHHKGVIAHLESKLSSQSPPIVRPSSPNHQLSSPPLSQRPSLDIPWTAEEQKPNKALLSVQAGQLMDTKASASMSAIHATGRGGGVSKATMTASPTSTTVLLPSLVLDSDHPYRPLFLNSSPPRSALRSKGKKDAATIRPGLRRCASTPSLSQARTGQDALDEDPLVIQLRASTDQQQQQELLTKNLTVYQHHRRKNGDTPPKFRFSLTKDETLMSSSSNHGDGLGTGRLVGQEEHDDTERYYKDSGVEEDHKSLGDGDDAAAYDEEDDDEESDEVHSADEARIAPGCPPESITPLSQSPARSPTPSSSNALTVNLPTSASTSFSIQQPNYVPPPHSLPMELVLLQTYNDSDHLPEHHEWTQDQDYWYYVTKDHGVKRPKLKKISSWWTDSLGVGSSSSGQSASMEPIATGPIYNMSLPPPSVPGSSESAVAKSGSSIALNAISPSSATVSTSTAITGNNNNNNNNNNNHSSNMLAAPTPVVALPSSHGERFLNVHGLASDVSLISLDSNGYMYNNGGPTYSNTTKRHSSPRNSGHSSKYYYVNWDEYISL